MRFRQDDPYGDGVDEVEEVEDELLVEKVLVFDE